MRVSKYVVVDEVKGYYETRTDVLGDAGRATGVVDPYYSVFEDEGLVDEYYTLAEAKLQAKAHYESTGNETRVDDAEGFEVYTYPE